MEEKNNRVGFIKDWKKLQEEYREESVGFNTQAKKFSKYLDTLPDKNSIIGFVGDFGTGKSALLKEVEKLRKETENEGWWQFDAWKYQDKSSLWKSFLLDFVLNVPIRKNFTFLNFLGLCGNCFDKILNYLNLLRLKIVFAGKRNYIWQAVIVLIFTATSIYLKEGTLKDYWWVVIIVPLGVFISKLFISIPVEHLVDLQKEFEKILKKIKNNSVIILEDVDRAGDGGKHFVETLSHFLRQEKNQGENKITFIVMISKDGYEDNMDSYLKSLDSVHFSQLPPPDMRKFVDDVFDEKFFNPIKDSSGKIIQGGFGVRKDKKKVNIIREQIIVFLGKLLDLPDGNIRKIKLVLRDAAITYERIEKSSDSREYDFRLIIAFIATRYFKGSEFGNDKSFAYHYSQGNSIRVDSDNPFGKFFVTIMENQFKLERSLSEKVGGFEFDDISNDLSPYYIIAVEGRGIIDKRYRDIMKVK